MSIHRLCSIDCFCDECHRSFGDIESELATYAGSGFTTDFNEARKRMMEHGWKHYRGLGKSVDVCPECLLKNGKLWRLR